MTDASPMAPARASSASRRAPRIGFAKGDQQIFDELACFLRCPGIGALKRGYLEDVRRSEQLAERRRVGIQSVCHGDRGARNEEGREKDEASASVRGRKARYASHR